MTLIASAAMTTDTQSNSRMSLRFHGAVVAMDCVKVTPWPMGELFVRPTLEVGGILRGNGYSCASRLLGRASSRCARVSKRCPIVGKFARAVGRLLTVQTCTLYFHRGIPREFLAEK